MQSKASPVSTVLERAVLAAIPLNVKVGPFPARLVPRCLQKQFWRVSRYEPQNSHLPVDGCHRSQARLVRRTGNTRFGAENFSAHLRRLESEPDRMGLRPRDSQPAATGCTRRAWLLPGTPPLPGSMLARGDIAP